MPLTTTASICAGDRSGLALASVSTLSSEVRAGGKNCASFWLFSGLVKNARKSAASCGCLLCAKTPIPAWPTTAYSPAGPAGSGTRSQANDLSLGGSEAREICVMVIAASPVKKSAEMPGPGMAFVLKMASCMKVIASTIGLSVMVQVLPTALQGEAPQPFQIEARLSQTL